jgi:chromate transporter
MVGTAMSAILFELAWRFAMISAIAFGGATAVMPEMHRFLVQDHHWIDDATFSALFAISQTSPGPNVLFVALFGWQVAGLAGAFVSLIAMCGPSSLFAVLVERLTGRHRDARWMVMIRRALTPITIGLLLATGWVIARGGEITVTAVLLTVATVFVGLRTRLNPLWMIALGALLGMAGLV